MNLKSLKQKFKPKSPKTRVKPTKKQRFNSSIAMLMVFLNVIGAVPINVFANQTPQNTLTTVSVDGRELEVNEDGTFNIENNVTITQNYVHNTETVVNENTTEEENTPYSRELSIRALPRSGIDNSTTVGIAGEEIELQFSNGIATFEVTYENLIFPMLITEYLMINGERISITDPSIVNITPIITSSNTEIERARMQRREFTMPNGWTLIARQNEMSTNYRVFMGQPATFDPSPNPPMSAFRYFVNINGVVYEAYCADPLLRGPENAQAGIFTRAASLQGTLLNVLRDGFPSNPGMSNPNHPEAHRELYSYATRVAAGITNHQSLRNTVNAVSVGGNTALANARALINGDYSGWFHDRSGLLINGQSINDTPDYIRPPRKLKTSFKINNATNERHS